MTRIPIIAAIASTCISLNGAAVADAPIIGHNMCFSPVYHGPSSIGGPDVYVTDGNCSPIAPGIVAPGTTPTSTSGSGQPYYVASNGLDSADGKTPATAWATLPKAMSHVYAAGDTLNFHGGDVWFGCATLNRTNFPSTSKAIPTTVGSYGIGRAAIVSNCPGRISAAITINGLSGFTFQDIIVAGSITAPTSYGVLVENTYGDLADTIVLQRLDVSAFYSSLATGYGSEIFVSGNPGASSGAITNLQILYNELHGQFVTSPDDNGIDGYGNGKNILNPIYRGNIVYNMGGHSFGSGGTTGNGIICNGTKNCLAEFNIAHDLGANVNTCGGPAGIWAFNSDGAVLQYNEVYYVRPTVPGGATCDMDGFDLDGAVTNSVVQYNYAHDNYGGGIITCGNCAAGVWGPNTIRYNVTENNDTSANAYSGEISLGTKASSNGGVINAYGNTSWAKAGGPVLSVNQGTWTSGFVANNIFVQTGRNKYNQGYLYIDNQRGRAGLTIVNNLWWMVGSGNPIWTWGGAAYSTLAAWATASGGQISVAGSIYADPLLTNGGNGGLCGSTAGPQPCPSTYSLQAGSPAIGSGLDLTQAPYSLSIGARNYFGNPLSSPYNLGAF